MRYIAKDPSRIPTNYIADITSAHLDEASLTGGAHAAEDARDLFNQVKRFASYDAFKQVLLEEQGYICCYCGCRIENINGDKAISEHLLPISGRGRNKLASYDNLLISCSGDQKIDTSNSLYGVDRLHCDASKGNEEIPVTPLIPDCDKQFQYTIDGKISGLTQDAKDTVRILNLDCVLLRLRRQSAMEILMQDGEILSEEELATMKDIFELKDANGRYEPYCTAVIRCIEEYLTK